MRGPPHAIRTRNEPPVLVGRSSLASIPRRECHGDAGKISSRLDAQPECMYWPHRRHRLHVADSPSRSARDQWTWRSPPRDWTRQRGHAHPLRDARRIPFRSSGHAVNSFPWKFWTVTYNGPRDVLETRSSETSLDPATFPLGAPEIFFDVFALWNRKPLMTDNFLLLTRDSGMFGHQIRTRKP